MTDVADKEFSKLEILVKAHRDELSKNQTAAATPGSDPVLSAEEQLWQHIQGKLQNERLNEHLKATSKPPEPTFIEKYAGVIAMVTSLVAVIGVTLVYSVDEELVWKLRYLAVAATGLGVLAAGLRLWAHRGSATLDGMGKMLGLSAAILALGAAIGLFWLRQ